MYNKNMKRFAQHYYNFLQANYYAAARQPHPIKRVAMLILATSFFLFFLIAIPLSDEFKNQAGLFTVLNFTLLFFGLLILSGIFTIVASIQGYRHKEKIKDSDIPSGLPSANVTSKQIYLSVALYALIKLLMLLYDVLAYS